MAKPTQASGAKPARHSRTKITAELMEQEREAQYSPNPHWRAYFLSALAETSNVTAAAVAAKVHPSRPYKVRRLEPEFAREWRAALLEGYENLELEVLHRLRFGEPKEGGVKFDNGSALRLLTLHRETVARERAMRENEELDTVRTAIHAKLDQLRRQIIARRAAAESETRHD